MSVLTIKEKFYRIIWNKTLIDEAAAIAITHLNTKSSNLVEMGIEEEGESFAYEMEFEIGNEEVSVEIDSQTGEVLVKYKPLEQEEDDKEE